MILNCFGMLLYRHSKEIHTRTCVILWMMINLQQGKVNIQHWNSTGKGIVLKQ